MASSRSSHWAIGVASTAAALAGSWWLCHRRHGSDSSDNRGGEGGVSPAMRPAPATAGAAAAEREDGPGLLAQVAELRRLLSKAKENRAHERTGRIRAEQRLKAARAAIDELGGAPRGAGDGRASAKPLETTAITPLGYLESVFKKRHGTPRQGSIAPSSRARLCIDGRVVERVGATDSLASFSHAWVIFRFHCNTDGGKASGAAKAKIRPPRLGRKVGILSTRTPHRPNALGLSLVKIEKVERGVVYFSSIDLLDGTPIYDIKPWVARYDSPLNWDPVLKACRGGGEELKGAGVVMSGTDAADVMASITRRSGVRTPAWVSEDSTDMEVEVLPDALEAMKDLVEGGGLSLYGKDEFGRFLSLVHEVLSVDVRSKKRKAVADPQERFQVQLDRVTVMFTVSGTQVTVVGCEKAAMPVGPEQGPVSLPAASSSKQHTPPSRTTT